jgi:hypothetical protein
MAGADATIMVILDAPRDKQNRSHPHDQEPENHKDDRAGGEQLEEKHYASKRATPHSKDKQGRSS